MHLVGIVISFGYLLTKDRDNHLSCLRIEVKKNRMGKCLFTDVSIDVNVFVVGMFMNVCDKLMFLKLVVQGGRTV